MYAKEMIKAILYCRVKSGEPKGAEESLDAQEQGLVAEATKRGFEFEVVRDDDDASGRDRLGDALDLLDQRSADVLMAVRLDRISGTVEDTTSLVQRSTREGWGIILTGEVLSNAKIPPEPRTQVELSIARRQHGRRTREGMQQRKQEGATFGRVVDRNFLPVYRRIMGMAEDEMSMNAIARALNREGVPTARGGTWHASTVRAILTSKTANELA